MVLSSDVRIFAVEFSNWALQTFRESHLHMIISKRFFFRKPWCKLTSFVDWFDLGGFNPIENILVRMGIFPKCLGRLKPPPSFGSLYPPLPYCFFQSQEGILDLSLSKPGLKDGGLAVILTTTTLVKLPLNQWVFRQNSWKTVAFEPPKIVETWVNYINFVGKLPCGVRLHDVAVFFILEWFQRFRLRPSF